MEPLIAALAKEKQREHGCTAPGRGKTLCQKSDKVIDTRAEAARPAGLKFLDAELGKYETWEKLNLANETISEIFTTDSKGRPCNPRQSFKVAKGEGVGQTTL